MKDSRVHPIAIASDAAATKHAAYAATCDSSADDSSADCCDYCCSDYCCSDYCCPHDERAYSRIEGDGGSDAVGTARAAAAASVAWWCFAC